MPVTLNRSALLFAFASLSIISVSARATERDVRVLHYESVAIDFQASANPTAVKPAAARTMRFTAFGKSYKIELEPNARIALPAATRAQPYRGAIGGRSNSWARITRVGANVHGMLFDGTELFAIEPAS